MGFRNKPDGEDEEGNCHEKDLGNGAKQSAEKAMLSHIAYQLDGSKYAEAGGKDAKEETT